MNGVVEFRESTSLVAEIIRSIVGTLSQFSIRKKNSQNPRVRRKVNIRMNHKYINDYMIY